MNENKPDSGASAKPKKKREKAVRFFLDADLQPSPIGRSAFYYHVHKMSRVPSGILKQWRKRGFKPLSRGIAHVYFQGSNKKYHFPAYFWNLQRVKK